MKTCEQCQYRFTPGPGQDSSFCSGYCRGQRETADRGLDPQNSKVCPCGEVFYRKPSMSRPKFAKRTYCSISCSRRYSAQEKRAAKELQPRESKICPCGTRFYRPDTVKPWNFARRTYCSNACAGTMTRKASERRPEDTRVCGHCGEEYHLSRKGETRERFSKRIACSRQCAAAIKKARRLEEEASEDLLAELTDESSEADSLRYYVQWRRDRMRRQWERELWQAMLTPSR